VYKLSNLKGTFQRPETCATPFHGPQFQPYDSTKSTFSAFGTMDARGVGVWGCPPQEYLEKIKEIHYALIPNINSF
jgi:hypothetical protein